MITKVAAESTNAASLPQCHQLIFQACFHGTSVIFSVTVMNTSVEFYSAQVTMHSYVTLRNSTLVFITVTLTMTDHREPRLVGKINIKINY